MPYEKVKHYSDIPFCSECNRDDFYTHFDIQDLILKCENFKNHIIKCRTVGVLKSCSGKFFIFSINLPMSNSNEVKIRVSMKYLKAPPKPTFIPYTVQIFGTVQWKQEPIVFASLVQVINTSMAIRLKETLTSVTMIHLAKVPLEEDEIDKTADENS
ncbi:unnamed protein product, partial [Iphiclides podalirius]